MIKYLNERLHAKQDIIGNLTNQEYTDDQIFVGSMLLHTVLQKLSEEPKLKLDAFDFQVDKKKNQHILVIWKNGGKLEPIQISNKDIAGYSLSEENKDKMKELLRMETRRIK